MSRPVATVAVPPLSCRVTGSAPQRKHELRCTCCLLYLYLCNDRMPMSIGSFSYTRSGLVSQSRSQFSRSSDVTSPLPPSGNEGYIRNQDVLLQIYILEHVFSWFIVELRVPH